MDSDTDPKVAKALRIAEFYSANVNQVFPGLYDEEDVSQYPTFNKTIDEYYSMLETCSQHQSQCQFLVKQETKQS